MGQKINPIGFRLAVNKDWRSKWYAPKAEFATFLHSDIKIRHYLKSKLQFAALSRIVIERAWNSVRVTLFTARPGLVIGRNCYGGTELIRMISAIPFVEIEPGFDARAVLPALIELIGTMLNPVEAGAQRAAHMRDVAGDVKKGAGL